MAELAPHSAGGDSSFHTPVGRIFNRVMYSFLTVFFFFPTPHYVIAVGSFPPPEVPAFSFFFFFFNSLDSESTCIERFAVDGL